jgi:hypothetical protein
MQGDKKPVCGWWVGMVSEEGDREERNKAYIKRS